MYYACKKHTVSKKIENPSFWLGGSLYFSHGKSNARRLAVLFKKKLNVNILNTPKEDNGQLIII